MRKKEIRLLKKPPREKLSAEVEFGASCGQNGPLFLLLTYERVGKCSLLTQKLNLLHFNSFIRWYYWFCHSPYLTPTPVLVLKHTIWKWPNFPLMFSFTLQAHKRVSELIALGFINGKKYSCVLQVIHIININTKCVVESLCSTWIEGTLSLILSCHWWHNRDRSLIKKLNLYYNVED